VCALYLGTGRGTVVLLESVDGVVDKRLVDTLDERRVVDVACHCVGELATQ